MPVSILARYQAVTTFSAKFGGFVTSQELQRLGVPASTVSRWCEGGLLIRFRRGLYRTNGEGFGFDEALQLALKLLPEQQVIGGRSALALWDLPGGSKGPIMVVGSKGRRSVSPHVSTTEYRDLRAIDLTRLRGIPVTTALRTIIDTSYICAPEAIGEQLTQGVKRGLFSYLDMRQRLVEVSRPGKRGVPKLRRVLATRVEVEGTHLNSYERAARRVFRQGGFESPTPQYHLSYGDRNYYVDFAWPGQRVLVECDSMLAHSTPEQLQSDLQRQNDLIKLGWTVFRFTYWDVVDRPDYVQTTLRTRLPSLAG